ncbi:MAG TPA: carboxyl transferase domain-containing protein [Acidimicrobiales bacterium]
MPFHPVVEEWDAGLTAGDPLEFPGYAQRLAEAGSDESVRTGRTDGYAFVDSRFEIHGGTLGAAAGEKVVRAYDRARDLRLPMVVTTRTGGARVQEGMVALVQLVRTAAAAERHADAGLLSLGIYGSPTTGGVFVSYASLVDLRAAHPSATIGFAGPRVAEGTLGTRLPPGSHTARSLYDQGLLDELVDPGDEAVWIDVALGRMLRPLPTRPLPVMNDLEVSGAWGEVLRARAIGRPSGIDRAARLCRSWSELRGDDPTVRAGLATIAGRRCVVIATDRYHGQGRPVPGGYRLAQRAVGLAGRLGLPVVTLVDTPGADPSPEAELDGVGIELARTFAAFASCPTPVVSVCVGEGGSGGALALCCGDRLLISEHAIFSVIGPEGAAAILERDPTKAPEVAERLRLTSSDLVDLGIADEVIPDGQDALDLAVAKALDIAVVGDRTRRLDTATARWLIEE